MLNIIFIGLEYVKINGKYIVFFVHSFILCFLDVNLFEKNNLTEESFFINLNNNE